MSEVLCDECLKEFELSEGIECFQCRRTVCKNCATEETPCKRCTSLYFVAQTEPEYY